MLTPKKDKKSHQSFERPKPFRVSSGGALA